VSELVNSDTCPRPTTGLVKKREKEIEELHDRVAEIRDSEARGLEFELSARQNDMEISTLKAQVCRIFIDTLCP
jgi:hypothetical protein